MRDGCIASRNIPRLMFPINAHVLCFQLKRTASEATSTAGCESDGAIALGALLGVEMRCCCGWLCKVGNAVRLLHFMLTVFVLYVLTATETTGKGGGGIGKGVG